MKTLSKKLKASQKKVKMLENQNAVLDRMLNNRMKELGRERAKVRGSSGIICALAGKIGDNFELTPEDLKNPHEYVCRIGETGGMEFMKKEFTV